MSDDPLYKKELLRLAADATGAGRLAAPDASAEAYNPACGDRITIDLTLTGSHITALAHETRGCLLTQASASILAGAAAGLDRQDLLALANSIRAMLKGGAPPRSPFDRYGAFDGAASHAGRHRCVLLPLEAALDALDLAKPGG